MKVLPPTNVIVTAIVEKRRAAKTDDRLAYCLKFAVSGNHLGKMPLILPLPFMGQT